MAFDQITANIELGAQHEHYSRHFSFFGPEFLIGVRTALTLA
jgi:hypothetical protein